MLLSETTSMEANANNLYGFSPLRLVEKALDSTLTKMQLLDGYYAVGRTTPEARDNGTSLYVEFNIPLDNDEAGMLDKADAMKLQQAIYYKLGSAINDAHIDILRSHRKDVELLAQAMGLSYNEFIEDNYAANFDLNLEKVELNNIFSYTYNVLAIATITIPSCFNSTFVKAFSDEILDNQHLFYEIITACVDHSAKLFANAIYEIQNNDLSKLTV